MVNQDAILSDTYPSRPTVHPWAIICGLPREGDKHRERLDRVYMLTRAQGPDFCLAAYYRSRDGRTVVRPFEALLGTIGKALDPAKSLVQLGNYRTSGLRVSRWQILGNI